MDDKIEEILAQYPVQIEGRKRIVGQFCWRPEKGSICCENIMALPAALSGKNASRRV